MIAFPMAKRVGKVRRVAEVLSVKRGAATCRVQSGYHQPRTASAS
ncbi:hypothetical protein [Mesorhizobium sp.]